VENKNMENRYNIDKFKQIREIRANDAKINYMFTFFGKKCVDYLDPKSYDTLDLKKNNDPKT